MFEPSDGWVPSAHSFGASSSSPPLGAVERPRAGSTRVWELPNWKNLSHPQRLDVMSRIADEAAEDPRLRRLAVEIFREAKVAPRDYEGQAAAILAYLQEHVYFLNEKNEVLQDPVYTLDLQPDGRVGPRAHGDCDDLADTFVAICRSIHLPAELVISGQKGRKLIRYIRGTGRAPRAQYGHAYAVVGPHPFRQARYDPATWRFADATVKHAALGWDCVSAGLHDPQRGRGRGGGLGDWLGDPGEVVDGLTWKTAAQLVAISVAAACATDVVRAALARR